MNILLLLIFAQGITFEKIDCILVSEKQHVTARYIPDDWKIQYCEHADNHAILHELGHHVRFHLLEEKQRKIYKLLDNLKPKSSKYAQTSVTESFAEDFALYSMGKISTTSYRYKYMEKLTSILNNE